MKLVQIYLWTNSLELAIPYAQNIVKYSNNPNFLINAYYSLLLDATNNNNLSSLSQYSHAREDANRLLESLNESYSLANKIIQDYNQNPHPWRWVWITIIFFIVLCSSLIICIIVYRKYAAIHLNDATICLQEANKTIDNLSMLVKEQEVVRSETKTSYCLDKSINAIRTEFPAPSNKWNDYKRLKKDINPWLHNWLWALDQLSLADREKILCIYMLLYPHLSTAKLAEYMNYDKDGIRVFKTRIAQKLGIKSSQIPSFVRELLIKE